MCQFNIINKTLETEWKLYKLDYTKLSFKKLKVKSIIISSQMNLLFFGLEEFISLCSVKTADIVRIAMFFCEEKHADITLSFEVTKFKINIKPCMICLYRLREKSVAWRDLCPPHFNVRLS